jgi:hypothetical protein
VPTEHPETWLEVDLAGDAIVGRLHDGDRAPEAFSGWLELVAALEAARARRNTGAAADEEYATS